MPANYVRECSSTITTRKANELKLGIIELLKDEDFQELIWKQLESKINVFIDVKISEVTKEMRKKLIELESENNALKEPI